MFRVLSGCKSTDFIRANKTKREIFTLALAINEIFRIFAAAFDARNPVLVSTPNYAEVAESVDASVSKTDEVTLVPVRSRPSVPRKKSSS